MPRLIVFAVFLTTLAVAPSSVHGDSWVPPRTGTYLSENGEYCLVVIPRGDTLVPAHLPSELRFIHPQNSTWHNSAGGIMYKRDKDSVYRPVWTEPLVNYTKPVDVFVHNEGKYIVTLDSWYNVGIGDYAVVVYDARGNLINNMSLADMLVIEKRQSFTRTTGSLWWNCEGQFATDKDEFVIRVVSNGEMPGWSECAICDDYLHIDLKTGFAVLFESKFEEALASYSDTCFDSYRCPTARYLHYQIDHPDSSVVKRIDSLELTGSQIDSLRNVYDCFMYRPPWELGAALKHLGRDIVVGIHGLMSCEYVFLVETHEELFDRTLRDSLPVLVRLPDSTTAIPIAPNRQSYEEGILQGGLRLWNLMFDTHYSEDHESYFFMPHGVLTSIYLADRELQSQTHVYLTRIDFGSQVVVDLTKPLTKATDDRQ